MFVAWGWVVRSLLLLLLDLGAIAIAALGSLILRDNLEFSPDRIVALAPYLLSSVVFGAILLPIVGTNRGFWRYSTFDDFLRVCVAASLTVLAATSATFAYDRLEGLARAVPILHVILTIALMCALRAAMRLRHGLRVRSRITPGLGSALRTEKVLVVGMNTVAELFVRSAQQLAKDTMHIVGVLGRNDRHLGRILHGVPVLGLPDELPAVLQRLEVHGIEVNRIVVTTAPLDLSQSARDALTAVEDGSDIVVDYFAERLGFSKRATPSQSLHDAGSADDRPLPSLRAIVDHGLLAQPYWRLKRAFDFGLSLLLIVAMAPVMLVVAAAVAIDIGMPVLFWQERPGAFGRRLRLYKFRTMSSAHDDEGNRIPESERSSAIGRFLRRTRLDELPQLFNILLGEMSFVGPRPLLPVDQAPAHMGRLAIRPGLTGWAQVHGGRVVNAADKAAMDLWYIRNASFAVDLLIATKTLRMVLFGERADAGAIAAAWEDAESWGPSILGAETSEVGCDPSSQAMRGAT